MRAVIRALLSRYPLLAVAVVTARWVAMTLIGFPIAAIVGVGGFSLGLPAPVALVPAVLAELVATGLALAGAGGVIARYVGWRRACRFRCRWPTLSAEIGASAFRNVSVVLAEGANYSGPDGFRPILAAPQLSLMPISLSEDRACWTLRPTGRGSFQELADQVALLPLIDDRIAQATLTRQPHRLSRWLLWIVFNNYTDGRGGSSFEPTVIDSPSGFSGFGSIEPPRPSRGSDDDGLHHPIRRPCDPNRRMRPMSGPGSDWSFGREEGGNDEE